MLNRQSGFLALRLRRSLLLLAKSGRKSSRNTLVEPADTMLPVPGPPTATSGWAGGGFSTATRRAWSLITSHQRQREGQNNAGNRWHAWIHDRSDRWHVEFNTANCNIDTIAGVTGVLGVTAVHQECRLSRARVGEIVRGRRLSRVHDGLRHRDTMDVSGNYVTFRDRQGGNDTPIAIVFGGTARSLGDIIRPAIYGSPHRAR